MTRLGKAAVDNRSRSRRTPAAAPGRVALLAGLVALAGGASCSDVAGGSGDVGRVAWRARLTDRHTVVGWHGVPATDGHGFFFASDSGITALEARTGRLSWSARLGDPLRDGAEEGRLVARGGKLYASVRGALYALDAATGAVRWRVDTPPVFGDAEIDADDGAVYAAVGKATVAAFDPAGGGALWTTDVGADWDGGAIVGITASRDTVYVAAVRAIAPARGFRRGALFALDRASGRLLWSWWGPDSTSAGAAPTVAGRLLLASDQVGGSFFAVDRFTVREVWRVVGDRASFGPSQAPVVGGDTAFVGSNDRSVYAVDLATGRVRWSVRSGSSIHHFALCGPLLLVNNQTIALVDRRAHGVVTELTSPESERTEGIPSSGFAVSGDTAFVAGSQLALAIRCR